MHALACTILSVLQAHTRLCVPGSKKRSQMMVFSCDIFSANGSFARLFTADELRFELWKFAGGIFLRLGKRARWIARLNAPGEYLSSSLGLMRRNDICTK